MTPTRAATDRSRTTPRGPPALTTARAVAAGRLPPRRSCRLRQLLSGCARLIPGSCGRHLLEVGCLDPALLLALAALRLDGDVVALDLLAQRADCAIVAATQHWERVVVVMLHRVQMGDLVDVLVADPIDRLGKDFRRLRPVRV